jgi:hypothetical protein
MVQCDQCEDWFHGECIAMTQMEADALKLFVCRNCLTGKSNRRRTRKPRDLKDYVMNIRNTSPNVRQDYTTNDHRYARPNAHRTTNDHRYTRSNAHHTTNYHRYSRYNAHRMNNDVPINLEDSRGYTLHEWSELIRNERPKKKIVCTGSSEYIWELLAKR